MTPLFGILQLDRGEPLGFANVSGLVQAWLQDAGGFAAVGLVVYLLYALSVPTDKSQSERLRVPVSTWMLAMAALALVCYAGVLALLVLGKGGSPEPPPPPPGAAAVTPPTVWHPEPRPVLLMVAGLFAVLGIAEPFVRDLVLVRGRRVWALAKLGFKEAAASRLYWVFLLALLPFLFRNVWSAGVRPVDEFRNLVGVTTLVETVLVLAVGLILAAFSLPTDIKNQTIHTVLTKPVLRFEVVLGRFLGYVGLMTLALAAMTAASLVLINAANINEKAEAETAKARVPVRGKLDFKSRKADFEGTNVGREFDYRKYIAGHPDSPQRAVWSFARVPAAALNPPGDFIPVEFTFDIFKMTKGEENRGAKVVFRFVTHNCPQAPPEPNQRGNWQWADRQPDAAGKTPEQRYQAAVEEYRQQGVNPALATPADPKGWAAVNDLAERFGFYEIPDKEVFDYAVMGVDVPAGLFRNARKNDPPVVDGKPAPRVQVYVKCESPGQMLGMAEPDLYLLESTLPFSLNFVKWAAGLWCKLCVVVGVAVACSTYLSGVLSLLTTLIVYWLGTMTEFLNDLALNRSVGGGPFESMSRLVRAESPTAPPSETGGAQVVQAFDRFFAWVVRRIQNVVPDVESFTWTNFVSEGFNVSGEYLVVNLLTLVGYLVPWFVLAYYLLKSREVAS
ncbi:MAG: hypothetical protein K2X87_23310 [Gemmataceae bacterium]|nr:hypothetical protein [Gemmataceae bacterium]